MINSQIYHPEVSVILPVFNAEKYLAESIKSILNQSFTNFELIIINDGSTDKSSEIIKSFSDIRIVYIEQLNMGLANTLNKGVSLAKGKYIARQDNDDISYPERFQKQFSYLENNAEIALIGTRARIVNEMGEPTGRNHLHPTNPNVLKLDLLFDNPFVHSSIFVRKDILLKVGGYYSSNDFFEDYNLWSRISYHYKVANLPEILLDYREVNTGMSKTSDSYSKKVFNQCVRNFNYYFTESVSENVSVASAFHSGTFDKKINELLEKKYVVLLEGLRWEKRYEKEQVKRRFILKVELNHIRSKISKNHLSGLDLFISKLKTKMLIKELDKLEKNF